MREIRMNFSGFHRIATGIALAPKTFSPMAQGERGSALIAVLLLLLMMSALAATLAISGRTETFVARNHQSAAQARTAAEAGLAHTVEVATTYISQWAAHGFTGVDQALDALLADPSILEPDMTLGTRIAIVGVTNAEYEVYLIDEDDPTRGSASTDLTEDASAANDEDGDPATDNNRRLIIWAIGYSQGDTSAVVEAVLAPAALPAVLTDNDLDISGNAVIAGTNGSVHSNGDMEIDSNNVEISGNASASGTLECEKDDCSMVAGTASDGDAKLPRPSVRASDYHSLADFILTSTGQVTVPAGAVLCDASGKKDACKDDYGWKFNDKNGWELEDADTPGTYYVEGDVKINGNLGSDTDPLEITVVAEGSIDINGNPVLTPDTPELMFVTDGDLKINGNFKMRADSPGLILVHEQTDIQGNAIIFGQVLVEDINNGVGDKDDLVDDNRIRGNAKITYDGNLTAGIYTVSGWRQVR